MKRRRQERQARQNMRGCTRDDDDNNDNDDNDDNDDDDDSNGNPKAAPAPQLSEYERRRLLNLRANAAMMAQLQIVPIVPGPTPEQRAASEARRLASRAKPKPSRAVGYRHSSRLQGFGAEGEDVPYSPMVAFNQVWRDVLACFFLSFTEAQDTVVATCVCVALSRGPLA